MIYNAFRPQRFEDMLGQDAAVQSLRDQVKNGKISHAYLFCGTRGSGKTTAAKIAARAVNCESPVNGDPCNTCSSCKDHLEDKAIWFREIDAASNNGVDDVRELKADLKNKSMDGRKKVILLDEVHMFSKGAFNALLKTLEDAPENVVFILATTEPHKIPVTIASRCAKINFRRIKENVIASHLENVVEQLERTANKDALMYIARLAKGSMRDALSILEPLLSDRPLTLQQVKSLVGSASTIQVYSALDALVKKEFDVLFPLIREVYDEGRSLLQFTEEMVLYARFLMDYHFCAESVTERVEKDTLEFLHESAEYINADQARRLVGDLIGLRKEMKYSEELVIFEAEMLRIASELGTVTVCERLNRLESAAGFEQPLGKSLPDDLEGRLKRIEKALSERSATPDASPQEIDREVILKMIREEVMSHQQAGIPIVVEDTPAHVVLTTNGVDYRERFLEVAAGIDALAVKLLKTGKSDIRFLPIENVLRVEIQEPAIRGMLMQKTFFLHQVQQAMGMQVKIEKPANCTIE